MTELPELLVLIRTIVLVAAPLIACGICILGCLILFGMPVLVAGALRARAVKAPRRFPPPGVHAAVMCAGINPAATRRYPLMREASRLSHRFFWPAMALKPSFYAILFSGVGGIYPKRIILQNLISTNSLMKKNYADAAFFISLNLSISQLTAEAESIVSRLRHRNIYFQQT